MITTELIISGLELSDLTSGELEKWPQDYCKRTSGLILQPHENEYAQLDLAPHACLLSVRRISTPITGARTCGQTGLRAQPDHGIALIVTRTPGLYLERLPDC